LKHFHVEKSFGQNVIFCTKFFEKLAVNNLLEYKNPCGDWPQWATVQCLSQPCFLQLVDNVAVLLANGGTAVGSYCHLMPLHLLGELDTKLT